MLKLYHGSKSRSTRVLWLLEELGIPYELVAKNLSPASIKSEEYLKVHPLGKLPAIEDEGVVMYESGAICQWLLEKYGNGRLEPKPGTPERAQFLQWMHFAEATAMGPFSAMFQHTMLKPEAERVPAVAKEGREGAIKALGVLNEAMAGKDWICGKDFTAADCMIGYVVFSARLLGMLKDFPNLEAYWGRIKDREAFKKAAA